MIDGIWVPVCREHFDAYVQAITDRKERGIDGRDVSLQMCGMIQSEFVCPVCQADAAIQDDDTVMATLIEEPERSV